MKSVVEEIKQTRPFPTLEEEAMVSLARTAGKMDHAFAELIKPYGLTPILYNILRILRGAGQTGLCRYEVGDRMITPAPDVTRLLDRLERKGYVTRERDNENRRLVKSMITKSGLDVLDKLNNPVSEFHKRHLGHLGDERLRSLVESLAMARSAERQ
ncbi:MAG: MarR family transcriptional regulator [Rhodothermales bacterium]